jgi:exonuclease SbcD
MAMIRIVHFSDLHLGVENYGRVDSETGLSTRVRDFLDRLDEVVTFALDEKVDVAVFSGDAFRDRHPDPTYQRDFARRIGHLARAGVAVVLVAGNHDLPVMLVKATSLDIFRALEVHNVYVSARKEEVFRLKLRRKRELQVATFPYPNRARLLLADEQRRRPLREQEELLRAQLTQNLFHMAEQIDPAVPAILVAHLMVLGADPGSEQRMVLGYEPDVLTSAVANPAYDAVLLGHVHRGQVLRGDSPLVLYAGSLERVDFGDEGQEKGFHLVEIAEGGERPRRVTHRFVPVNARAFLTLEVDAARGEPMDRALQAIAEAREAGRVDDAVVRLRLHVRLEDAGRVDVPALRRALEDAFFVAAVTVEVERPERVAVRVPLDHLEPLDALERYWIARSVSAKRREVLSEHLQELMSEEQRPVG